MEETLSKKHGTSKTLTSILVVVMIVFITCTPNIRPDGMEDINTSKKKFRVDSSFVLWDSTQPEWTIFPGQGIDDLVLGDPVPDILNFKNIAFDADSGEGITCGTTFSCHTFHKSFHSKDNGLTLEYESECFPEGRRMPSVYTRSLRMITIRGNRKAALGNGLRIGVSTYFDVANAFVPVSKNKSYMKFEQLGIAFFFDKNQILWQVEIFEPSE